MLSRNIRLLSRRYSQAVTFRTTESSPYLADGEKGAGKSLTLAHLLHFAHEDGFLIVHIPWVSDWLRRLPRDKEMSNSQSREGFVDIPLDAAAWLLHFKMQNQVLLKTGDLKTSKEYVWSKRESTPAGAPLAELVEHGIARVKYACDVIDVLLKEIKLLSNAKKCKTFVAIDGFNSFFYPLTRLSTPTKKKVAPEEVSLTAPFMEITKNDWTNGAIVVTTDQLAVPEDRQENYLPKYLLYQKGFEHLDPFVPMEIGRYTEREFLSCASYYRDRLWLRGPPELESELKLASACNPYNFMELCAPL
ncbi:28S ribosomal protein S29, mitochondrial isoform X2 [Bicyclus anynana]|uniref:Small ribosomal subunit protein mS29 n=1 Tax=Bicyclus anynana TaxID=110368 RepID=A0ABM3LKK5_BICAN|nr:28S ribosomal protein S29, mitochondrial isoform X2 [Bicyclus anynana]